MNLLDYLVGTGEQEIGTVRPSAFAALRLMINSNVVGCSNGRSEGLAEIVAQARRAVDKVTDELARAKQLN